MIENKIDFIICYNSEKYIDMCTSFLAKLAVPEGYETEVIGASEITDLAEAYNELMNASEAKYKVYLLPNVFITDEMFIFKMLEQFQADPGLGMLGCVGAVGEVSATDNGVVWNAGKVFIEDEIGPSEFIGSESGEITALNGFVLATQVDIPWETRPGDTLDMFDISHSIAMRENGCRIDVIDSDAACCHYYPVFTEFEHLGTYVTENGSFVTNLPYDRMPLVSCIIPAYNAETFLKDTLNSVVGQSYRNLEIFAIDDASKDNTKGIIQEYADNDNRVRPIFHTQNCNVCVGSNEAYRQSSGKYIAIIGHDDLWKPEKIARQVSLLERHGEIGVCFTTCTVIGDDLEPVADERRSVHELFNQPNRKRDEWIDLLYFRYNALCAPSALVRNDALNGKLYTAASLQMQDYELWLRMLIKTQIYIIQEELTLYRQFAGKSNLSTMSADSCNRLMHEDQFIKYNYLKKMDDAAFIDLFHKHFTDSNSASGMELQCERALILYKLRNVNCINMFMELFDDDGCRKLLADKYGFSLRDFYKMNNETIMYNYSTYATIRYYEDKFKELTEKVNKMTVSAGAKRD